LFITGRTRGLLDHIADVGGAPSRAHEHAADGERALVPRTVAGIVPLEQASDRELAHHVRQFIAGNPRGLALAQPRDRLTACMQRRREDGRCARVLVFVLALVFALALAVVLALALLALALAADA